MKTRTILDLARGIVLGQNCFSQQEAYGLLLAAVGSRNIKLRDVAAAVVATARPAA